MSDEYERVRAGLGKQLAEKLTMVSTLGVPTNDKTCKVLAIPSKCKTAIPKLTDSNVNRIKQICRAALEDLANGGIPKRPNRKHNEAKI